MKRLTWSVAPEAQAELLVSFEESMLLLLLRLRSLEWEESRQIGLAWSAKVDSLGLC